MALWIEPPARQWGPHWAQTTRPCGAGLIQLLARPGLSPAPAWEPQGPHPPSLPTGGSRLRRFGLTVKGEWWPSAGAPSWGGRVFSGIRATRESARRQATCKMESARLRRSALNPKAASLALESLEDGSHPCGERLCHLRRGLGRQAERAVPHTAACAPQSLLGQARPAILAPAGQRPERRPRRAALGMGDRFWMPPGLGLFLVAHQSVLGAGGMVEVPQTWGRRGVALWGPLQPRCGPPWPPAPQDCGVGPGHCATALRCRAENTSRFAGVPSVPRAEHGRRSGQSVLLAKGCVCACT